MKKLLSLFLAAFVALSPLSEAAARGLINPYQFSVASYTVDAVTFDGSNDFLRKLSGASATDSTKFTFSFWARRNALTQDWLFAIHNEGGASDDKRLQIFFDGATAPLKIMAKNAGGTDILELVSSNIGDTNWHHYAGSFDLTDTGKRHLYIDGVSDIASVSIYTNDTIQMSGGGDPKYIVGNQERFGGAALMFNGDMAQFYFESDLYIDLSNASNLAKLISVAGNPVDMGSDGSLVSGTTPDIFLNGALAGWSTNKGSGGGFEEVGALTTAGSAP